MAEFIEYFEAQALEGKERFGRQGVDALSRVRAVCRLELLGEIWIFIPEVESCVAPSVVRLFQHVRCGCSLFYYLVLLPAINHFSMKALHRKFEQVDDHGRANRINRNQTLFDYVF